MRFLKRLDVLVLKAFFGPFVLTVFVVTFIFLMQTILKYVDELVGKGLGFLDYAELMMYFSMNILPVALPLAILLSSLMTFGNLGQFNELTAVKSSGISLLRVMVPIAIWVIGCTIGLYFFNNYVVPKANLKAYSLLYDLRQKKPSLDLKPGVFYNGIPGYSIKIVQKFNNDTSIKGVIIYDHTQGRGNTDIIIADSGAMYLFNSSRYLALELFHGNSYSEVKEEDGSGGNNNNKIPEEFMRNAFEKTRIVFDLASFDLSRTKEELFTGSRQMKTTGELARHIDSVQATILRLNQHNSGMLQPFYYYLKIDPADTIKDPPRIAGITSLNDTLFTDSTSKVIAQRAANQARSIKAYLESNVERDENMVKEIHEFQVTEYQKYTQAVACFVLFLIGAPLGAIIKKGGLGVPVLICIIFFIFYYVFSITGEKWTKEGVYPANFAMWFGNGILFCIGLFFMRQAKNDSRILESDFYLIWIDKIKKIVKTKK
ncbi:LptF/LptG family permease [uncultured Cytophaga sp.]|uniref:LptF/LptG family permease n=1 Tax=uncultured Cytophaga sp. TaxID=160238 RepID=UPI00260AC502|nr:LptF/LptG family permease [uncultured Cytophaga sp.]